MIDAHAHFWDPSVLRYPWLDELPALRRTFGFDEYARSLPDTAPSVDGLVFVESNCEPARSLDEVAYVQRLATDGAPIAGIVAFADMTDRGGLPRALDALCSIPLVRGVRQNIQGQRSGFCTTPAFVDAVREVGSRGFTFDLCITHDQLTDVVALVRACPGARFILDHCGKPAIRDHLLEPWRDNIASLAAEASVVACKLSGLLTEAGPGWREADVLPFAEWSVGAFGADRMMYGSDWPVVTLAGGHAQWYEFTRRIASGWTDDARRAFYHDNAVRVYRL